MRRFSDMNFGHVKTTGGRGFFGCFRVPNRLPFSAPACAAPASEKRLWRPLWIRVISGMGSDAFNHPVVAGPHRRPPGPSEAFGVVWRAGVRMGGLQHPFDAFTGLLQARAADGWRRRVCAGFSGVYGGLIGAVKQPDCEKSLRINKLQSPHCVVSAKAPTPSFQRKLESTPTNTPPVLFSATPGWNTADKPDNTNHHVGNS